MENIEFKKFSIKFRTCHYFDDIVGEDFDFDKILLDGKSYKNILVYDISYKALTDANPLHFRFDKVD